ncbi:MAG: ATP-dependent Clp protease proteolytic subunit, partial [Bifidobacteriaceae bacterium]|nr:ATP-dependent Clp protease proteolytic subunit [Bifidobacteriaceae bacterium]
EKGKRLALPNARVLIHQPAISGGQYAKASDIEIHSNELLRMRAWLEETLEKHSNMSIDQIRKDIERDKILDAKSAKKYGLIDSVLDYRKKQDDN